MFYRRKFLLAFIESFGGKLDRTDFEKLLFLFCQNYECSHYYFFPYKYGPFSYVTYFDKRILTKQGFLIDNEKFQIKNNQKFIDEITPYDRNNLNSFSKEYSMLRGKKLIKKVYAEYSYFASKSEIIKEVFSNQEFDELFKKISNLKKQNETVLFSLGYEGLTIDSYLNKLIENNISLVIDVRKNPRSMKFDFNQSKLKKYLLSVDIDYLHLPALGIDANLRKNLHSFEDYIKLLGFYKKTILAENIESLNTIFKNLGKYNRISLLCFEKKFIICHRSKISEYFQEKNNIKVIHLN